LGTAHFGRLIIAASFARLGLHGDHNRPDEQRAQNGLPSLTAMQYVLFWVLVTLTLTDIRTAIHSITVAGHQADFTHHDPLSNITIGAQNEAPDCHRHPELKRKIYSALQEGSEGELGIAIPREVPLKHTGHISSEPVFSEREWPESCVLLSF
jgi:hypothetical protein